MKTGDCVCLKTGGYLMTVAQVCGEAICCMWFDENQQLHKQAFWRDELNTWRQV